MTSVPNWRPIKKSSTVSKKGAGSDEQPRTYSRTKSGLGAKPKAHPQDLEDVQRVIDEDDFTISFTSGPGRLTKSFSEIDLSDETQREAAKKALLENVMYMKGLKLQRESGKKGKSSYKSMKSGGSSKQPMLKFQTRQGHAVPDDEIFEMEDAIDHILDEKARAAREVKRTRSAGVRNSGERKGAVRIGRNRRSISKPSQGGNG